MAVITTRDTRNMVHKLDLLKEPEFRQLAYRMLGPALADANTFEALDNCLNELIREKETPQ